MAKEGPAGGRHGKQYCSPRRAAAGGHAVLGRNGVSTR